MKQRTLWRVASGLSQYMISSTGAIRGPSGRILKQATNKAGYKRVCLIDDAGKRTNWYVHRLVALAWIRDPRKKQVMHIDGDPQNNAVENLRVGSQVENERDKRAHGRTALGERNGMAKFSSEMVEAIKNARRGQITALAKQFGMSPGHAFNIRYRKWRKEG